MRTLSLRRNETKFCLAQGNCRLAETIFRLKEANFRLAETKVRGDISPHFLAKLTKFRRNLNNICPKCRQYFA